MTTRYVYLLREWHIAGEMMRGTLCGEEIPVPVYSSTSTGDEAVCDACKTQKALTGLGRGDERR